MICFQVCSCLVIFSCFSGFLMYPFGFFQVFSFDVFLYVFFRFSNVIIM